MINMGKIVHIFGALRAHIVMFCADLFVSIYQSKTTEVHHIAWLPGTSPLDPNGVITLLENGPHSMSNKVEIG